MTTADGTKMGSFQNNHNDLYVHFVMTLNICTYIVSSTSTDFITVLNNSECGLSPCTDTEREDDF
jgi:hypothetical protein